MMRRGSYDGTTASIQPHLRGLAQRRRSAPNLVLGRALGMSWSPIREEAHCLVAVHQCPFVLGLTNENSELILNTCAQLTEGLKTRERHLFLLSDVLVIAKLKSNASYRLKHRIDLKDLWVCSFENDDDEAEDEDTDVDLRPSIILAWSVSLCLVSFWNEEQGSYGNIMYDRRVVRGNTYAQHILPITSQPDPVEFLRQQEARRRSMSRRRLKEQFGPKTPDPLEGRMNIDVQTEMYLEELSDHTEEVSVECQTDMFLDKPATPLFIPAKTGRDAATQIEEGELFDFDMEVQPVLQVLVGKTIEQSLQEVLEEEELDHLMAQQQAFREIRDAELVEVQRLEERERRLCVEKENRIKQQKAVLEKEKETAEKIAARAFAQQYLTDLLPSVYSNLRDCGYFYDPVKRDIETEFLPWLMEEVSNTLEQKYIARTVVDQLIRDVTIRRFDAFQQQK